MSDIQHKEWFITELLYYIRLPLMQQNIATQSEDLEIAMKLEASLVGENATSMNQIQTQLVKPLASLQYMKPRSVSQYSIASMAFKKCGTNVATNHSLCCTSLIPKLTFAINILNH